MSNIDLVFPCIAHCTVVSHVSEEQQRVIHVLPTFPHSFSLLSLTAMHAACSTRWTTRHRSARRASTSTATAPGAGDSKWPATNQTGNQF